MVRNVHGLTLDEPLAVTADNGRIINYNWRGQGMSSVFLDGRAGDVSLGNTATQVDWPAATQAETYFAASPDAAPSNTAKRWLGTFVANGQGTTGMLYRRNRYFDPKSGQFTQADPIGIAGGMNVFGFANGDPVNFSDPFGLCTPWPDCWFQAAASWGAQRGGALGSAVLNTAAAANAGSEAFGVNDLGRAIGEGDVGGTAIALAGMLPVSKVGKVGKFGKGLVRTEARNLAEQFVMAEAKTGAGVEIMAGKIKDSRYPASGWAKMSHTHKTPGREAIEIHYWKNRETGAMEGFKYKNP